MRIALTAGALVALLATPGAAVDLAHVPSDVSGRLVADFRDCSFEGQPGWLHRFAIFEQTDPSLRTFVSWHDDSLPNGESRLCAFGWEDAVVIECSTE